MFPSLIWFLVSLFVSAEVIAARSGAACERGCIVAPGVVYELSRNDVTVMARAVNCEVASVLETEDAAGAVWALTSGFVRRRTLGWEGSFGSYVAGYSGCAGKKWSSEGWAYNERITPRADANWKLTWDEIPGRSRDYVFRFFHGEIQNPIPGAVWFLTDGWEEHADPSWIGPYTTQTHGPRSRNLYWKDRTTVWWTSQTVRLVPPSAQ